MNATRVPDVYPVAQHGRLPNGELWLEVAVRDYEASEFRTAGNDRTFKKAYKELRQAVRVARPEYPSRKAIGWCRVEDTHVSKWVVERDRDGAWTLIPAVRAATRRGKVA